MKYVVFQSEGDPPFVVLVSNNVMHRCAYSMVRENDLNGSGNNRNWAKPLSAGFVRIEGDDISCYGESESLELSSRPEDVEIVRSQIRTGQYR